MKTYNIGDVVWVAKFGNTPIQKLCPVCFGKQKIVLILGNGENLELPCDYCNKGYDPPTGYVTEYDYIAESVQLQIDGIEIKQQMSGEKREYRSGHFCLYGEDLFDTKEEADTRANEKAMKYKTEQETLAFYVKGNKLKSYSWNAGYHLRAIRSAEKEIAYHSKMATICKLKAKDGGAV